MVKKIGIGLVVLLLIIGGGLYYVFSNLDELVRSTVEKAGTRVTSVDVTLGKVEIDLGNATAGMGNLNVANPVGFKTDYAFNLGDIRVSLDSASIGENPIVVKEVIITDPRVIYEMGEGLSNVETIQANVDQFIKENVGESSSGSSEPTGDEQKVIINDLYIRGAEVSVSHPLLEGEKIGTTVPEIHLTDIGKGDGGASPAEVAGKVIDQLLASVGNAVSNIDIEGLTKDAQKALEGVAGEAAGAVEGISGGAGEAAGGAAEEAGNALKGLLGD